MLGQHKYTGDTPAIPPQIAGAKSTGEPAPAPVVLPSVLQCPDYNTLSGTPEQVTERIAEYADYGIRYFFIIFPDFVPSETLELFAAEVMARVNG